MVARIFAFVSHIVKKNRRSARRRYFKQRAVRAYDMTPIPADSELSGYDSLVKA
jgi:hypothetical protein